MIKTKMNLDNKNLKIPLYVLGIVGCFIALTLASNVIYDIFFAFSEEQAEDSAPFCNVIGINLHGELVTYIPLTAEGENAEGYEDAAASENIVYLINQANSDSQIKAIAVESDSYGGLPVAGEEVAQALKHSTKPTVAIVRQGGLSAAYWAVSGANHIIASKNSNIGSIGVTTSYLDNIGKNKNDGRQYVQLPVGKFKDAGDPDKVLTLEEKNLIMRDLQIVHKNFIADVAANRKLSLAAVTKLADGSSVLGEAAKSLGLIDEIGGAYELNKYLTSKIGEQPEICWQ